MVTVTKKMMLSMMILRPHQGHWQDDDEHDDVTSPPGSLTSGWRAGGMQGKAQGSLSCRPELDPALAEVEPAADYIPLFPHCTQSRIFDKYALDRRFLRYQDMKWEGRRFMGVCRKLQILAVRVYPDPFRTQIFHQKGVPWSKTSVKIWEESSLYLRFRQIWGVIGAEGSKHGLWGGRRPKDSTGRQNPGLLHKSVLEEQ